MIEHHQIDPALLRQRGQLDQIRQRPPQPVEPGNHHLVATPGGQQRLVQTGPTGQHPGGGVGENLLTPGRTERVLLRFRMLITGGDPGQADPHPSSVKRTPEHVP